MLRRRRSCYAIGEGTADSEINTEWDGVTAVASGELRVSEEWVGDVAQRSIAAGEMHASLELDIVNRGGPTSGAATAIDVAPSIEIKRATLTLLDEDGISPFQILR